jgi:hypothetical protein
MDRKDVCGTCRYWVEIPGWPNTGECRQSPGPIYERHRKFWCGSWYPKEELPTGLRAVNEALGSHRPGVVTGLREIEIEPMSPLERAYSALRRIERACMGMGESATVRMEVEKIAGEILAELEEEE